MTLPVRMQLSRRKGFNLQEASRAINGLEAVHVGRPGPWGNPFAVGKHGDAAYCVDLYKALLAGLLKLAADPDIEALQRARRFVADNADELCDKNLACWCAPGAPCHADVLLKLVANQAPTLPNGGRASAVKLMFVETGEFKAYYAAQDWLRGRGFSCGQGQRGAPSGILFGDFTISKWKNMTVAQQRQLHGELTGDHREGPVVVTIFADAPEDAVRAATKSSGTGGGE